MIDKDDLTFLAHNDGNGNHTSTIQYSYERHQHHAANLRRIKRICFRNLDVEYVRGALVRSIWWTSDLTSQFGETVVL